MYSPNVSEINCIKYSYSLLVFVFSWISLIYNVDAQMASGFLPVLIYAFISFSASILNSSSVYPKKLRIDFLLSIVYWFGMKM